MGRRDLVGLGMHAARTSQQRSPPGMASAAVARRSRTGRPCTQTSSRLQLLLPPWPAPAPGSGQIGWKVGFSGMSISRNT